MDILFVDDMISRHSIFRGLLPDGHNVTYVFSFEEAKEAISTKTFDLVFLDHDLAEDHYGKDSADGQGTGYDIALLMVEKLATQAKPLTVLIHTMNHVGSKRMLNVFLDSNKHNNTKFKAHILTFGSSSFIQTVCRL